MRMCIQSEWKKRAIMLLQLSGLMATGAAFILTKDFYQNRFHKNDMYLNRYLLEFNSI